MLLWLLVASAQAEGIAVSKVEVRLGDNGYQLAASYNVELNPTVQHALSRGIPLYFVGEFSLTRPRWNWVDKMQQSVSRGIAQYIWGDESSSTHWAWLDEDIYTAEQTIKLSYNVLTRQYRISRGSLLQNFASFSDAINILSRQNSAFIQPDLLDKEESYVAGARLRLDIAQLPNLLQVNALTDSNWILDSDWYHWVIRPEEIASNQEQKAE